MIIAIRVSASCNLRLGFSMQLLTASSRRPEHYLATLTLAQIRFNRRNTCWLARDAAVSSIQYFEGRRDTILVKCNVTFGPEKAHRARRYRSQGQKRTIAISSTGAASPPNNRRAMTTIKTSRTSEAFEPTFARRVLFRAFLLCFESGCDIRMLRRLECFAGSWNI